MGDIIPFKPKPPPNDRLDRFLEFVYELMFNPHPSSDRMDFIMGTIKVTAHHIHCSYEEQQWKHLIEDNLMAASGLTSLMMSTPEVTRTELFDVAAVDVQLWNRIPRLDHFITASEGGFEYNVRTINHDIAQIAFQIQRGD